MEHYFVTNFVKNIFRYKTISFFKLIIKLLLIDCSVQLQFPSNYSFLTSRFFKFGLTDDIAILKFKNKKFIS